MRVCLALALAILVIPASNAYSQTKPLPTISNATDGVFAAFRSHPLVGLGENHGLAQELDFYATLLRDPRFAKEVGNVVLEAGGAAQQATVDRYVNGGNVPYEQLRKVWTDSVGWFPTVTFTGSINIYATIRAVNQDLPPDQRIKVWLGEPKIDWAAIKTKADWDPLVKQRDTHPAELIETEILAKGKKALVIYGNGHFGPQPYSGSDPTLRMLVESRHPGAFFFVEPYVGFGDKGCTDKFESAHNFGAPGSLVSPVAGTKLEDELLPPGCHPIILPPSLTQAQQDSLSAADRVAAGLTSDAILYLGPSRSLTRSPTSPDIYLDGDFRAELERRMQILTGAPLLGNTVNGNPAVARRWWAN